MDVVHVDFELIDVATEYDDYDDRWWGVVAGGTRRFRAETLSTTIRWLSESESDSVRASP